MNSNRNITIRCNQGLGDVVLLTAALRDLHRIYPNTFSTSVSTSYSELWLGNPNVANHAEHSEIIDCRNELIHSSNSLPYHAIHSFAYSLSRQLGLAVHPTEFRGDVYLQDSEMDRNDLARFGIDPKKEFWLLNAGSKSDYTVKRWATEHFVDVVKSLGGDVLFVQVGAANDFHPRIPLCLRLVGRTTLRDLVSLVYHCQGVLCGVTGLMHLAAAVPCPPRSSRLRPAVILAGGREPAHWEAYPGHKFFDSIGQFECCATGGCWKSRTQKLSDGSPHDDDLNLCVRPDYRYSTPLCMSSITPSSICNAIMSFIEPGALLQPHR